MNENKRNEGRQEFTACDGYTEKKRSHSQIARELIPSVIDGVESEFGVCIRTNRVAIEAIIRKTIRKGANDNQNHFTLRVLQTVADLRERIIAEVESYLTADGLPRLLVISAEYVGEADFLWTR